MSESSKAPIAYPMPEPTAFLECAGTWEFAPGELDVILAMLEQMRDLDLEEQNARISSLLLDTNHACAFMGEQQPLGRELVVKWLMRTPRLLKAPRAWWISKPAISSR